MTVSCDEFLAAVKRLVTVPAQQELLDDEDILALGTDLMRDTVTPLVLSVDEDYFVTKGASIPILPGVSGYAIPSRSVARKLREIKISDASGQVYDFPKINIARAHMYQNSSCPFGFHFQGDKIELVGSGQAGYSLILYWPIQPGKLVPFSNAGRVSSISGDDVSFSSLPMGFTTAERYDFINGYSGNWFKGLEAVCTNIAGSTLSFSTGSVPTDLSVGDFVSITGTSPVLQIPDEGAPLLQTLTAYDVLGAISDFQGQDRLMKKIEMQKASFLKLMAPRIDGEPNIIINDRGLLRGRSGARNRMSFFRG